MALETLLAGAVVDQYYSNSGAGAIIGERGSSSVASADLQADSSNPKVAAADMETTDPAFYNFYEGILSRLVLREYNYSQVAVRNRIIDPFAANWLPALASPTWSGTPNLHAVAAYGSSLLYATGYDLGKLAVISMSSSFAQKTNPAPYQFPDDFATGLPGIATYDYHGEGLQVIGNNLYALFSVNTVKSSYDNYGDSIVAKFTISARTGALTYVSYERVGKNAFTFDLYNSKFYICCLGGKQQGGSGNADTCLSIVDLSKWGQTDGSGESIAVKNVARPTGATGDYRDIAVFDNDKVYVLLGYYNDSNFTNMLGEVYLTDIANLEAASPTWNTPIKTFTGPNFKYLYGIHADTRFWLINGDSAVAYAGLPTTSTFPTSATFGPTAFSPVIGNNANLNSVCFVAPNQSTMRGASLSVVKSFAPQAKLAREARMLAEEAKKRKKDEK